MPVLSKRSLKTAITAFLVGAVLLLGYELAHWYTHVYESGARVQTDLTRIASRVDGAIDRILVEEGDRVKAGALLVVLAHEDIQLNIDALEADLALEEAHRARLVSERGAFEIELQSKLETQRQQIAAGEVEHQAIGDRLRLAEKDLSRVNTLYKQKLTSERELAAEQDKVLILRGEAALAAARIEIAKRELAQVEATRQQLNVIADRIRISDITATKIRKMLDRERVALGFRHIRSPIDSVIDRVYKHKGEFVEEGESILILHDENVFWVEAQIDEDQLRHLRPGQTVLIHLEAYPFDEYRGEVTQIGSATATEMGIETERGSRFGRPAQRVPVRISIADPPPNLAPGMLANVNVQIYDAIRLRSVFHILRMFHSTAAGHAALTEG